MAPPPHRRNAISGRPGQAPMSERQQMALLMQMTSSDAGKFYKFEFQWINVLHLWILIFLELSPNSQNNYKPRERNERGETLLHIASKKGDLEGAKKLLEQGSNPNVTDFAGELLKIILKQDEYLTVFVLGWTPLHEACNHGHYHLAQLLIKHGANVMATGFDDVTPLHDAAMFGNQKLVKMLIDKGADPLFKNKKGKTPQDVAHHSLIGFFKTTIGEFNLICSWSIYHVSKNYA